MNETNYADDLALLTNTPAQTESLIHFQQQVAAAGDIDLNVNAYKTKHTCFKQKELFLR